MTWSVPGQKPPANGVPAAAVIRRGQALSGIIGRKARAGAPLRSACARFTPNNSGQRLPPTYYRGCWHVVSWGFLVRYRQGTDLFERYLFFTNNRVLRSENLHHSRGVAPSDLRPLRTIPCCCLPYESGPCVSPGVADHPLRSATHRCLGKLLSHRLANAPRAHL